MDGRAATAVQFQMAGHEVGEEHVADLEAERPGVGQVLLDVALRIDDDGGRTGFVSDQIRSVRQAAQVVLLQKHKP
jgi:imidazole glycerol phosphate synthase subunit HisF